MPTTKKKTTTPKKKKTATPTGVGDLHANEANPREPWDDAQRERFKASIAEFGDLSGIVFNRTTGQLVGGHKRVEEFNACGDSELVVSERLKRAAKDGTRAYGHVVMPGGARFSYREVEWDQDKENAANLAANQWGAEWDFDKLSDMVADLQSKDYDLTIAGFSDNMLKEYSEGVFGSGMGTGAAGDEPEAPGEFKEYGEDIETDYRCPQCGYEWSGSKGGQPSEDSEDGEED